MRDLVSDAEDLGEVDYMDVIDRLVPVAGLNVVDVGCGGGRLTRQLAERGAKVLGVEPDPIQAEKNRAAAAMPGLSFVEAPGQALPIDDGLLDGVFFSYSLHHVPREIAGELRFCARNGHWRLMRRANNLAHRDAGGGAVHSIKTGPTGVS